MTQKELEKDYENISRDLVRKEVDLVAYKTWLQQSEQRATELRNQIASQWLVIEQLVNLLVRKLL
jgi:hypothetical protein